MLRSFPWPCWLLLLPLLVGSHAKAQMIISGELVEIVFLKDTATQQVLRSPEMFREGWHQLPQIKFWRRIMRLDPKYSYLNVAETREILTRVPTDAYHKLSAARKQAITDSFLTLREIPLGTKVYVTSGKSDFYQFYRAMPHIHRGIQVFMEERVDPWYAQAILLIESPGANLHSSVGAAGQFQLMRDVAISHGLVVNNRVDERLVFDKAAKAASRHINRICLPHTRKMLDARGITYQETDLWFRLLVMHVYHAGAGNVAAALRKANPTTGNMELIQTLWQTNASGFQNASQNYSQLAIAALIELEVIVRDDCKIVRAENHQTRHQ